MQTPEPVRVDRIALRLSPTGCHGCLAQIQLDVSITGNEA
jgi:hypothetical protein